MKLLYKCPGYAGLGTCDSRWLNLGLGWLRYWPLRSACWSRWIGRARSRYLLK